MGHSAYEATDAVAGSQHQQWRVVRVLEKQDLAGATGITTSCIGDTELHSMNVPVPVFLVHALSGELGSIPREVLFRRIIS